MKGKMCFMLLMLLAVFNSAIIEASELLEKDTYVVTVTADVPAGYDRDIVVKYKESGVDGWCQEFKLTNLNGYKISQRLEEGTYQCVGREALDSVLSSEEILTLYSDKDILVSVVDKRSSEGVTTTEPVPIEQPAARNYGWMMPVIAIVVVAGMAAAIVIIVRK